MTVRERWDALDASHKRGLVFAASLAVVSGLYGLGYLLRGEEPPAPPRKDTGAPLRLEPTLLEDDMLSSLRRANEERERQAAEQARAHRDEIAALRKAVEGLRQPPAPPPLPATRPGTDGTGLALIDDADPGAEPQPPRFPPPPGAAQGGLLPLQPLSGGEAPQPRVVGGIGHLRGDAAPATVGAEKKSRKGVYLAPSFMEGTLLTGLRASTTEFGVKNPQAAMIRVAAPAILPNRVKADLKGCFVVAHGFGGLDSESVSLRLVSLSCLAASGASVIDQEITGYVADADGFAGLSGRVVSKMGAAVARSMVAGLVGGIGEAARAANTTTSVSPLGQTSTLDPEKVLQAGIGTGIGKAGDELQRFFLDLARQATPVIEVGPTKPVTVVVTKGVFLEIKDHPQPSVELAQESSHVLPSF